jgi:hypothetical protein
LLVPNHLHVVLDLSLGQPLDRISGNRFMSEVLMERADPSALSTSYRILVNTLQTSGAIEQSGAKVIGIQGAEFFVG